MIVLVAFMGYAFKKIQTVDVAVAYLEAPSDDELLKSVADELDMYQNDSLLSDAASYDLRIGSIRVLLVNHQNKTALLWHDGLDRVLIMVLWTSLLLEAIIISLM